MRVRVQIGLCHPLPMRAPQLSQLSAAPHWSLRPVPEGGTCPRLNSTSQGKREFGLALKSCPDGSHGPFTVYQCPSLARSSAGGTRLLSLPGLSRSCRREWERGGGGPSRTRSRICIPKLNTAARSHLPLDHGHRSSSSWSWPFTAFSAKLCVPM